MKITGKLIAISMFIFFVSCITFDNNSYAMDIFDSKTNSYFIGHRGSSGSAPQNTVIAIKKAFKDKYDAVAIDPRLTADNKLVLCHDETTKGVLNKSMWIDKTKYKMLTSCCYKKKKAFGMKGVKLCTLDEALRYINKYNKNHPGSRKRLYIKLSLLDETASKFNMSQDEKIARLIKTYKAILRCIKKNNFPIKRVTFWGFDIENLDAMHSLCPEAGYEWYLEAKDDIQFMDRINTARNVVTGAYDLYGYNYITGKSFSMKGSSFTLYVGTGNFYIPDESMVPYIRELKERYNVEIVCGLLKGNKKSLSKTIKKFNKVGIYKFVMDNR